MKKLISIILALVMALSLCVTTTWADVAADTSWYTGAATDATEYIISDAADLLGLADIVNGTATDITADNFEGKTIKLGGNIDLSGVEWTPIGGLDASKEFKGTLDGDNKTISNLTMTLGDKGATKVRAGLFASLTGTVKNLTLSNVSISANGSDVRAGALAAYVSGNAMITNVKVNGFTFSGTGAFFVGGLTGFLKTSGVLGASGIAFANNCTVNNVNITVTATGTSCVGGVNGYSTQCWYSINNVDATNVTITVTANAASDVGGFFGGDSYNGAFNYRNCDVKSLNITLNGTAAVNAGGFGGHPAGGVCGPGDWDTGIFDCTTQGTITNNNTNPDSVLGGYYGYVNGGQRNFDNCIADVDITSTVGTVGGFSAKSNEGYAQVYNNCVAKGDVRGNVAGGFVGVTGTNSTYNNCGVGGTDEQTAFFGADVDGVQYVLNFNLTGGTGITSVYTFNQDGSTIDLTAEQYQPTRDGYSFVGWVADAATVEPLLEEFLLNEGTNDTTLYAVWELIPVEEPPAEDTGASQAPINRQDTATGAAADTTKADDTDKTDVVTSAKTFDAGVAVYGMMAVASLLGMGYVGKKRV